MKFHFALLGVLCAHALAQDESSNKLLDATATSTGATGNKVLKDRMRKRDSIFGPSPKNGFARGASAAVMVTAPPTQSNGTSIMSSCPGTTGTTDKISVGVQGILAKNGVEYVYLPMGEDIQAACFESYNKSVIEASDLVSCCDAAAERKFNSFCFNGGVCTGFTAWLSPIIDTECYAVSPGLYVAKKKLSNFTSTAPTFSTSSSLWLARIWVTVTNVTDACPYLKTLKITTYSNKVKTVKLLLANSYFHDIYLPELCDDNATADKRTVTVSILDWDGSVLTSATEVLNSSFTGRHLLPNGVCVLYSGSPLQNETTVSKKCWQNLQSREAFEDDFVSLAYVRQELAKRQVNVLDFWTEASLTSMNTWVWFVSGTKVNMSLFNKQSLGNLNRPANFRIMMNVNDGLLYITDPTKLHATLCIDVPYY